MQVRLRIPRVLIISLDSLTMSDIVIAAYRRSPFTPAHKGALAAVRPDDIAAGVVKSLVESCEVDVESLEDLRLGCAFPEAEQGFNLARMVTFLAGLPQEVAGATTNRFCGSSMQTIHDAAGALALGSGVAYLCGGVESMSRVPMTGFNPLPHPGLVAERPEVLTSMGITAENLAVRYGIDRRVQDEFAVESHRKAAAAAEAGNFDAEIVEIEGVSADGCIRPDTSVEVLSGLGPAFDADGSVTAGTSSPLTDGAAFVLVCTAEHAEETGLTPLARIVSTAVSGCAPDIMGIGPVSATRKVLDRAGIGLDDIDVIELNEAFAAQSLAVIEELGIDERILNIDGGAIALGHPLGASGARITGKAADLLGRVGGRYALATMCIGGGMGIATVLESCQQG